MSRVVVLRRNRPRLKTWHCLLCGATNRNRSVWCASCKKVRCNCGEGFTHGWEWDQHIREKHPEAPHE